MNKTTEKDSNKVTVKKFHQFIEVEKGPVNSAVIDLLKGNVYQVENNVIDSFHNRAYEQIPGFMKAAAEEELMIEIAPGNWTPENDFTLPKNKWDDEDEDIKIQLHVEGGVDLQAVLERFGRYSISRLFFYGKEIPGNLAPGITIIKREKDFEKCVKAACVDGDFKRFAQSFYTFNKTLNSCWGNKIAITADGKIRPCIYSEVSIGDFETFPMDRLVKEMEQYWEITKDRVERCKDCELRYVCFDCREIARRQGGDLFAANPYCKYDPYKGTWTVS